ncbi:DUF72 domain-containing protein [Roseomonas populi]|uniref:DUF72 domain-containing protein n=1 Tax=Roseomonas populi TaxID=3121582 RepID=A0ABT1XC80_9PROT|nr:DUF72 domain-containing protein [Roseomonas pecuniae]MCR0985736.1 DUF72 domain-containing protein [Roseomonas pecuniae]
MTGGVRVGTAGWSIPKQHAEEFDADGSHLERYARRLPAVEINSSFYRPHRPATYERWAASVPGGFRFSAKVPRTITHDRRLQDASEQLQRFLGEVRALGDRLGPLLVQLPPSLCYDEEVVERFLSEFREAFDGGLACEPRHESWFTDQADKHLAHHQVARVAADPAVVPRAAAPGGWPGLIYHRLHGSPEVYSSPYSSEQVGAIAQQIRAARGEGRECWCIFDNTALGWATRNALDLLRAV